MPLGGAPSAPPSPAAPARPLPGLDAALEGALVDALAGRLAHEALEGTLAREARAVLLRHGLGAARVAVGREGETFVVAVRLPGATPRVHEVRLRLD
jgi:hypothetical protein